MMNESLYSNLHFLEKKFSISIIDITGTFTYVNEKFCDLTLYKSHELVGQTFDILTSHDSNVSTVFQFSNKVHKDEVSQRTFQGLRKDKKPYWTQSTIIPIQDDNGAVIQYLSFDVDITFPMIEEGKYHQTLDELYNVEHALNQSTIVAITNNQGVITYTNDKFHELSQYKEEEIIGHTHLLVNSSYHTKEFFQNLWNTITRGEIWSGEIRNEAKDGSHYWVYTTIVPFLDKTHTPYQYIAIQTDITEKKQAEELLKAALKNDFRQTVKHLQNAIFKYTYTADGKIDLTLLEGKIVEKLGKPLKDIIINVIYEKFPAERLNKFSNRLKDKPDYEPIQFELTYKTYTFLVYLSPIYEDRKLLEVVGTATDITARKEAEKVIEHMAYNDDVTNLPNRRFFQMKVNEMIDKNSKPFAIMFIDLDRFKNINDSMGHSLGDQLLKAVGNRIQETARKADFVARHGGDEYVLLLEDTNASQAESIASQIIEGLQKPFHLNGFDFFITASIGISLYPTDGKNYDKLIGLADSAMYIAKVEGKNKYRFFTKELHLEIIEKTILEMELRKALQEQQLSVYYQPQISLQTNKIIGIEALIRWNHPIKGLISPALFIPIAEESGLIISIGKWILEETCRQMVAWQKQGVVDITLSVNVAIHQFTQPSFVKEVKEALLKTGLQANYLNLEITESMTADATSCQTTLLQLREIGVNVSIDDFGTGYSSLSYISKFPITHLKIDRSFLQELNRSNRAIINTIISLGKNLDVNVIAEGVENEEQVELLKTLGCELVQGFFYYKPMPSSAIEDILLQSSK